MKMNKVMITGANGFIGSHIVEFFLREGIEVGCFIREKSNVQYIEKYNLERSIGDIRNSLDLKKAFQGYDFVIHNAARASDWGSYKEFYETNVIGTLNVLKACVECNIKNIIMTGTNSVYGEENSTIIKDENSPYNSHYPYFMHDIFPCKMNYYRDTKSMAKKQAMDFAKRYHLNLIILEPVFVYGEREFHAGFYEYLKTASTKIPFLMGSKKNKFHIIYARDLARAYFLAYKKELKGIHTFLIGNQNAEHMEKIYSLFCKEAGLKKPYNIPKVFIYPIGFMMELFYTLFHCKTPPLLTRGRVNMFYDNTEFSVKKAEEILGFRNEYSLEEGIHKTVSWYKREKLI